MRKYAFTFLCLLLCLFSVAQKAPFENGQCTLEGVKDVRGKAAAALYNRAKSYLGGPLEQSAMYIERKDSMKLQVDGFVEGRLGETRAGLIWYKLELWFSAGQFRYLISEPNHTVGGGNNYDFAHGPLCSDKPRREGGMVQADGTVDLKTGNLSPQQWRAMKREFANSMNRLLSDLQHYLAATPAR